MTPPKSPADPERQAAILAHQLREQALRQQGYRERALRLFPHVCASCGREFAGKRLKELTVHHKDHDHTNNPPDGRNWELLCVYCHDHEHEKYKLKGYGGGAAGGENNPAKPIADPFAKLDDLLREDTGT